MNVDKQVLALYRDRDYDAALRMLMEHPEVRTPDLWVAMGDCMQLSKKDGSLHDVESCYRKALEGASENLEAMLELGWYFQNVWDDPLTGMRWFKRAEKIARRRLKEAQAGLLQCKLDVEGSPGCYARRKGIAARDRRIGSGERKRI